MALGIVSLVATLALALPARSASRTSPGDVLRRG
jgi:hypothetical protein